MRRECQSLPMPGGGTKPGGAKGTPGGRIIMPGGGSMPGLGGPGKGKGGGGPLMALRRRGGPGDENLCL